jgi:hypothetical protein
MLSLRRLTMMRNSSSFLSNTCETCDKRRALPRWSAKETYLLYLKVHNMRKIRNIFFVWTHSLRFDKRYGWWTCLS